jgi:hypothetical protein
MRSSPETRISRESLFPARRTDDLPDDLDSSGPANPAEAAVSRNARGFP